MARRTNADDPLSTRPPEGLSGVDRGDTQSDPLTSGASSGLGSTGSRGSTQSSGTATGDGGIVDSAKQTAGQMVDSAKQTAGHVVDQVKEQATSQADQQRQSVASGFEAVAHAFRGLGDGLRNQDQGPVAQYAAEMGDSVAGQVERFANYLRGRDVRQIVNDTEDLARRSPVMFLGGAFVLGFAASRFLKSSRPTRDPFANMPDPNRALPPASTSPISASSTGGSRMSYGASAGSSGSSAGMPGAGSPGWSGSTPSTGSGAGSGARRSWPGGDAEPTGGA